MNTIKFKCTLMSDVILNMKSANTGPNKTLDFIPGNCFLGISASTLYKDDAPDNWKIFHSGRVRFGDAHPSGKDLRSLKVPASMFYPKLKRPSDICYIHHCYDREYDKSDDGPLQLKQCRDGFYEFCGSSGKCVKINKSFAVKSAYDRSARRSKDKQMYGYESLDCGQSFLFRVDVDDAELAGKVAGSLIGVKRLGRSRTAQYGLVNIERIDNYVEVPSGRQIGKYVTVYADGRIIFLDGQGQPTFRPEVAQLGLSSGRIRWDKSQIRTFRYAPWNYKRQAFDADRCGIEKGSVFVVEECNESIFQSRYIGSYNNEGFGAVIYNPSFLNIKEGSNGEAACILVEDDITTSKSITMEHIDTPLIKYVKSKINEERESSQVYAKVNKFVESNASLFHSESFASQWGTIRSLALSSNSGEDLKDKIMKYLTHGISKDKWMEKKRCSKLKIFIDDIAPEFLISTIVNLSSEMAKKSQKH